MTDWTTEAVDTLEKVVGAVRERTVLPAHRVTRSIVFGVFAGFAIFAAVILLIVGVFRGGVLIFQGEVWAAWLLLGGIFMGIGLFIWAKRSPRSTE